MKLRLVEEAGALGPDARRVVEVRGGLHPPDVAARTAGKAAGGPLPGWTQGEGGAPHGSIALCQVGPATVWPQLGAVADADGRLFKASAGEALASGKTVRRLERSRPGEAFGPSAVFLPYGGTFNYGHFLLDALPSLLALQEAGELDGRTVLAPRLKPWQRDLLAMGFPEVGVHQTAARAVSAETAVWADSMDHYLHRPGPIVSRLRERILDRAIKRSRWKRIYLSRRNTSMRVLLNEAELEQALEARDFLVLRPERLPARVQVALFRNAETVVGATGAALANALFAARGARVVELLPQTYAHPWVRDLCLQTGADWRGWFEPAPLPRNEVPWRARLRRGFRFGWSLDLPAFLDWFDRQVLGDG